MKRSKKPINNLGDLFRPEDLATTPIYGVFREGDGNLSLDFGFFRLVPQCKGAFEVVRRTAEEEFSYPLPYDPHWRDAEDWHDAEEESSPFRKAEEARR